MSGVTSRRPFGFALVELLVVMTTTVGRIGLFVPAMQNARAADRRLQCQNNHHSPAKQPEELRP